MALENRTVRFSDLETICAGTIVQLSKDRVILNLVIDSRKAVLVDESLFFAIRGDRHDGHLFIQGLYAAGLRQFIVEKDIEWTHFPEGNFLKVTSAVEALQKIVTHHRKQFNIPVIGITGSNGKTIIKEWLFQLLNKDYHIVKNPGSYNSQVGVPLSVWQIQLHHTLGIFEAGISLKGEMGKLQKIITPTIGIFTNIGTAHDEGFESQQQKLEEKLRLFDDSEVVIACADHYEVVEALQNKKRKLFLWGQSVKADVQVSYVKDSVHIKLRNPLLGEHSKRDQHWFHLPFTDAASRENVSHGIATLLYLGYEAEVIQGRIEQLKTVPMRLQVKQGINNCTIIDDTYNNDLGGLQISLDFLIGQARTNKTLIISDILQSGLPERELTESISDLVEKSGVTSLVGIGPVLTSHQSVFRLPSKFYQSTDEFLQQVNWDEFQHEVVLVKGARAFAFEKIIQRLQRKIHGTVMEIDVAALVHNLNFFKSQLKPNTKLMVMVKAFAYGSGSVEVANLLQYHKVDYLGVAYADEGVELRKNQIAIPIMVMNPSEETFDVLLDHHLEPEIYSLKILKALVQFLAGKSCTIHVKLDTGMHRLGFDKQDLAEVVKTLKENPNVTVATIFSHLAGADDAAFDSFSEEQADLFLKLANDLKQKLQINPALHLLNSSGILRLSEYQLDMVRLGIGLYGVDPTQERVTALMPVATLKTIISQIRKVNAGESIGYGRKGKADKDLMIATIAIGYADGFSRAFSQGRGVVLINGKRAPVIGNVCMDMTMIDITSVEATQGAEVILFGKDLPIQEVAERINTIPYEILTSTSERVKRVFYAESI